MSGDEGPPTFFVPDWTCSANVSALVSTRRGGQSDGVYAQGNLAFHVGDDPEAVIKNRQLLAHSVGIEQWQWLNQVHSSAVVSATVESCATLPTADACYTRQPGVACAVLTADCLPVLLCSRRGDEVAAVHAGWRGLCAGVLNNTLERFTASPKDIFAYLGPAIGPQAFEVGEDVRDAFAHSLIAIDYSSVRRQTALEACFLASSKQGKYWANLYAMASEHLLAAGVQCISGGDACTYGDAARFYSYRRDGCTGRFASAIWINFPQTLRLNDPPNVDKEV